MYCLVTGPLLALCVRGGPGLRIGKVLLGADGGQADLLRLPAGGSRHPASKETLEGREHYLKMDGKEIFKHAVRRMEMSCEETLRESGLNEVTYLVPHQANVRIIDAIAKRCGVPEERVVKKVDCFGNTSASSIGLCLDQMEIKDKDTLLLVAFGAGLTWGSVILTAEGM